MLLLKTVFEMIRDAGDSGIISGHLYAGLCGMLSLSQYEELILLLKATDHITEENHILKYQA